MVYWKKLNETSLPEKKTFLQSVNMEDISDAEYAHTKEVFKGFEIENLGEYHDLCIENDTLLLDDIFENFRNMCLWI